ncbi:MAG: putative Ig domain-containing protein, partial [Methanomassiliicoccales archaeon]
MTEHHTKSLKKGLRGFIISAILLGNILFFSIPSQASPTEKLIEENKVDGGGEGYSLYMGNGMAQCFNASSNYVLTRVSLYVKDEVPNDDSLGIQIFDNNPVDPANPYDDEPGGQLGIQVNNNGPDNEFAWLDFYFTPGTLVLTAGTRYWIVAGCMDPGGYGYRWKDSNGDEYPNGYLAEDGVPFWILNTSNDLMFRVYGMTADDVGVEKIIVPQSQEIYCETNVTATIKNYGANPQEDPFDVRCTIKNPDGIEVFNETKPISNLVLEEEKDLSWYYTPMLNGTYTITVTTLLTTDDNQTNDAMNIEMNVSYLPIIKLHHEINVNGNPNDWIGDASGLGNDSWKTSRREYIWKDKKGDDNGDGNYSYPTTPTNPPDPPEVRFEQGCLDLLEFRVCVDATNINFLLIFDEIDDGSGDGTDGSLGFSEQIIEILIDTDRDGTGRDDTIRNARLKLDRHIGWEYVLWVDGWKNGYGMDEGGQIFRDVNARGSPLYDAVEISIPAELDLVPDFEVWRYVVLIGAQDNNSLPYPDDSGSRSGFMRVDEYNSSEGGGGGQDLNGADPNVYDMAFASPQVEQLSNYGNEDFMFASFNNTSTPTGGNIDENESWAQCFSPPFTCLLSSVDLYAKDVGDNSTNMSITIHFKDAEYDLESAVSSTETVDFGTNYEWQRVEFSNPPVLRKGKRYWIVPECTNTSGNGYQWGMQQGDLWPDGIASRYYMGSWSPKTNYDMLFNASLRDLTVVNAYQAIYFAPIVINEVCVNGSVDFEWVNIYYNGTENGEDIDMTNWALSDQDGNIFWFDDFLLSNKESVTVHSGFGSDNSTDLFWDNLIEVWNDFGDDVLVLNDFIPVDFMNYTDGNVFGNDPPKGLNWGPEGNEKIPRNPKDLQALSLRIKGRDNDFFKDWEMKALGWIEEKTLYLHDDCTYSENDPYDLMDTTPPIKNELGDPDTDGVEGLTLSLSGETYMKFQEFNLTPVLAKEFIIADDVLVELLVDDDQEGQHVDLNITLFDCNETEKIMIASHIRPYNTDEKKGWELVKATLMDVDYTLENGRYLILRIELDSSDEGYLWLAYNSTRNPSCIRSIPTRTFVNVDWASTYDVTGIEKSDFIQGEEVIIKANVSDPFGSYDITGANITIDSSGGSGGGTEKPMILNATDPSDPSAWKLFNYTFSDTNKPGTYTVEIEAIESNGVVHEITIFFNVLKNAPPTLTDQSLIPTEGNASLSFNFTINYTDMENNPPDVITVNITGLGIFGMLALDPDDSDFTDGDNLYYVNITGFVNDTTYSYHFAANDSKGLWNDTDTFWGPLIVNTPPTLSDWGLNPTSGNVSTPFNFTINYTDIDDQPPNVITVNITGPSHQGSWEMLEVDPYDVNFTDGKLYYYNHTGLINGTYSYHYWAKDTQDDWDKTAEFPGPDVVNTPPELIDDNIWPESGYITTEFNYTVTYIDLDNQAPANITVNISGPWHAGSWKMIEVDADTNYADGKDYYYTYTGLKIGSYSFHIAACDSEGAWYTTSEVSKPTVYNTAPTLSPPNLYPTVGEAGVTDFNYTVIYTDLDNQSAGKITVNITGPSFSGNFTMIEADPSDTNYTDGKIYYFNTTLPNDGTYNYTIYANDTGGLRAEPKSDSGPNVGSDAPPVLTNPGVSPEEGITTTWFNFTVNFTDPQNDPAGVITLNLSGPTNHTITMLEVDPSDIDTDDGKFFYYNLTGLKKGAYRFYVQGNDSLGNYAESANRSLPQVYNSLPQLLGSYINESDYGGSWLNFTLIIVDIDNDSAGSVNINISGLGNFTMNELDPMDTNWSDGKEFYYNLSIPKGSYSYCFEANDTGLGMGWTYTTYENFDLKNNIPSFSEQGVSPSTGFGGDYFNFTVNVSDYDDDSLEVYLYIPEESGSPFTMIELDTSDTNTKDGKLYFYNLSLAKGTYNYNFSVFDGETPSQTTPLPLIVKNNPPVITTSDVANTDEDILYSVDYDNFDLDGDAVTWTLDTNATWLTMDFPTGLLEGTPSNLEVGSYYVNVSVGDGDGGIAYHNFTLNVTNTLPLFTTTPDDFAKEDILHLDDFDSIDDGPGTIYSLGTNATWLNIDSATGLLSGTPDNRHVGWYWVNVSVNDGNGGIVSLNYTLTVNNTPPSLSTTPDQDAVEDILHLDGFNCDDDGEGNIVYSLLTNATWLSLNPDTGILSGTPDNTHVGSYWVNVTVDDGNGGSDSINYSLTVYNVPPDITSTPDDSAFEDSPHIDDFDSTDEGQGDIVYTLMTNATWLNIVPQTGVLSGTPDNTQVGSYWVNVTVDDGNGGSDSVNYTLWVINTPPTITTTPIPVVTQDIPHYDNFDCIDDGQGIIVYSMLTNATWLYFNSTTGELNGTPNNTHLGWSWVNVSVTDGNGGMDYKNYTLTVDDVNDPPIITTPDLEFAEEDSLYSVDYEYIDIDDPSVTWQLQTNSSWLSIDPNTGVLWGTPENDDVGSCWVNITVNDGRGGFDSTNFTITVNNTPPSITSTPIEFNNEDEPHWDDFNCSDDNQGNIVYSLLSNATWLSIDPITGMLGGTANNTQVGWYWVNVTVSDGNGGSDSRNYTITVINTPPTITTFPDQEVDEDSIHTNNFDCVDDDQGNIVYSVLTNGTWLSFDSETGILFGLPDNRHVGWYWVNISVNDGNGGIDFVNYTLTVHNVPPIISTIPDDTAVEDSPHSDDFDCNDDGQGTITYYLVTNATWLSIDPQTGELSGTPNNAHIGLYFVNITVDDGNKGDFSINYTLTVSNTPPTITTIPDDFAFEDSLHSDDFNCNDDNQGNITYHLITNATWLALNSITGVLSGIPNNTHVGWFWVNVSVTDGNGGMDSRNYTLTVDDTNDDPNITTPNLESALEDTYYEVDYEFLDIDGDTVTWHLKSNASWLDIDENTGVLNGTPANDDVGSWWVNVTIDDGRGGFDYTNFTIIVNNTAPIITNTPDEFSMEDEPHLDDFNCDDDYEGNISYSLISNATWLSINSSTGVLSGTPNNAHIGWFWVNVSVYDGNDGYHFKNYTLNVTNSQPTINSTPHPNAYEDILYIEDFNCIDDGQGLITYYLKTNASWLLINSTSGVVSGMPENEDVGTYWVNITVTDGNDGFHSINYSLTVINTNDPPKITTGHTEVIDEDTYYYVDFEFTDVDDVRVNWSLNTNASWLSIDINTGVLSGTPENVDVGWYFVNVTVKDDYGDYDFVNFVLIVNNTNDPPS